MSRITQLKQTDIDELEKGMNNALSKIIETLKKRQSPSVMNSEDFVTLMTAFPIFAMTTDMAALKEDLEGRDTLVETWEAARERMKEIPIPESFEQLSAKVIEKRGICQAYEVGDTFYIQSPFFWPANCPAIWFSAWPYLIAAGFGFEGWEGDNPNVYRISCASKKGVVIEFMQTRFTQ